MNLQEFIESIRGWTGYHDPAVVPDNLIISWIRMGEERLNVDLRIADMVQIDTATIFSGRVVTPLDWLSNDFLRVYGEGVYHYLPRDQFYRENKPKGKYSTAGKFLLIGGEPDEIEGRQVELHYFGDVPKLIGDANWVSSRYLRLLTSVTMVPALTYLKEPDQAAMWELDTASNIDKLNFAYRASIGAGSKLTLKKSKGFG